MRVALTCALAGLMVVAVAAQAPAPSQPVFRGGVDLLAVDVTALDGEGRQVRDLTPSELTVEVDGEPREVVSADYIALVDPRRPVMTAAERRRAGEAALARDVDPHIATNSGTAAPGRLVMIIVDQGNIRSGGARQYMDQARRFVDQLQPEDRVAVAAIPPPGDVLDFTTNHDRVKEALLRAHGTATTWRRRFNISLTEALAIHQNSDARLVIEVFIRECGANLPPFEADRCERELDQEAGEAVMHMRQQSSDSLRAIRDLLRGLALIEGNKQVILISEGLVLEHLTGEVDELAGLAADARASIDVLLLDVPAFEASQRLRPTTPRQDRDLQEEGLDALAALARGTVYRVATTANFAFERISRALAGYYLLAVESRPSDKDGKRHRISVKTSRRGVTLRSRRSVLSTLSARSGSPAEAVSRALRSPLPIADLPMRLSAWTFKEPGSTRVRVLVAVEVERGADRTLEYTAGLALIDRDNRASAPAIETRTLTETGEVGLAHFHTALLADPGTYRLRVAMADSGGRIGSIERTVEAFLVDGSAATVGDLLLGTLPEGEPAIAPTVEPRASGRPLAALLEAYLPQAAQSDAVAATLDVMRDDTSPIVLSTPMREVHARAGEVATLQALVNTTAIPPGRYLARATVTVAGKAVGHVSRPFRVEVAAAGTAPMPAAVPPAFAEALVGGLTAFDPGEMLDPAVAGAAFALAAARGAGAAGAVREAGAGRYGAAALAALDAGDQVVAAFLKGLDLLAQGQAPRAAIQLQSAMTQAPQFTPARLYLGAALAATSRHREAAGLLQSGAVAEVPGVVGRVAGEEWLRARQYAQAIPPLEAAAARPDADARTRKLLGLAYALADRAPDALPVLTTYLEQHQTDAEALLAALYAVYSRHAGGAQPTLAADRGLARRWLAAYNAGGGTMSLAAAWVAHLDALK